MIVEYHPALQRERHPGDSPARLRRRLAGLWLGPELARKAYGPLSKHE